MPPIHNEIAVTIGRYRSFLDQQGWYLRRGCLAFISLKLLQHGYNNTFARAKRRPLSITHPVMEAAELSGEF